LESEQEGAEERHARRDFHFACHGPAFSLIPENLRIFPCRFIRPFSATKSKGKTFPAISASFKYG